MKTVGEKLEAFSVPAAKPGFNHHEENGVSAFETITEASFPGKWKVIYFYPKDFTFVCPTELEDLADKYAELQAMGVEVYAVSTDTHFSHKSWHDSSPAISKINYHMLGDQNHVISNNFGVLREGQGLADRATFVVDPDGVIQVTEITCEGVGRNAVELVRKIKEVWPKASPGNGWGMTETSATATSNSAEDYENRPDSCGPAVPVTDLKIMTVEAFENALRVLLDMTQKPSVSAMPPATPTERTASVASRLSEKPMALRRRMARAPLRASSSKGNRWAAGKADPSGTTSASRVEPSRSNTSSLALEAPRCGRYSGGASW